MRDYCASKANKPAGCYIFIKMTRPGSGFFYFLNGNPGSNSVRPKYPAVKNIVNQTPSLVILVYSPRNRAKQEFLSNCLMAKYPVSCVKLFSFFSPNTQERTHFLPSLMEFSAIF